LAIPQRRGGDLKRGASPLLDAPDYYPRLNKGNFEEAWLIISICRRVKERRSLSYITNSPLSFEGEGDKGGEVDKEFLDCLAISS